MSPSNDAHTGAPVTEQDVGSPARKRAKLAQDQGEAQASVRGFGAEFVPALQQLLSSNHGDAMAQLLTLCAEEVVWRDSLLPYPELCGVGALAHTFSILLSAFPDAKLEFQGPLQLGENGLLLGYWTAEGTHTGPGLKPLLDSTGLKASWSGSLLVRTTAETAAAAAASDNDASAECTSPSAASGIKAVEVWWSWDPVVLYRQLGWKEGSATATGSTEPDTKHGQASSSGDAPVAVAVEGDVSKVVGAAAKFGSVEEAVAAAEKAVAAAAEAQRSGDLAAIQQANRGVIELYFHTYNSGHYEVLNHIVHPDYHYAGLLDLGGKRGKEAMKAMMGGWRDCMPDLAIGHELFAAVERDLVVFRWVIQGSHQGPSDLLGVPPRGQRLLVKGVTALTLHEGRICKKVSHANGAHTLAQLGVLPLELLSHDKAAAVTVEATAEVKAAPAAQAKPEEAAPAEP